MKMFVVVAAVLGVAGCQQDTKNLERKLDLIIAKLDKVPAGGDPKAPRPQRPEPDRAKTYAVPIDGDAYVGPADAKVTLVEAFDYG